MKMTFLGSGGAFSRASENFHNNVLVEIDGYRLLIDCGTTALESIDQLESFDDDPHKVDGVVITHIHADHVGGLEELAFRNLFLEGQNKLDLFVHPALLGGEGSDGTHLWENCLKGGLSHIQDAEGVPVTATMDTYFNVHSSPTFEIRESFFEFVSTEHVPDKVSFGLRISTDEGTDVIYTADSTFGGDWSYADANVIFHDCMFMPKYPSTVHTHFEELCGLDEDIREKMFLMHYGNADNAPDELKGMKLVRKHQTFEF